MGQRQRAEPSDPSPLRGDLVRGHLDGLILAMLEEGPLHGYGVCERLLTRSSGAVSVPTGTLYPALHRIEQAGWVTSEWSDVQGRRRRTYALTRRGARELATRRGEWAAQSTLVTALLGR